MTDEMRKMFEESEWASLKEGSGLVVIIENGEVRQQVADCCDDFVAEIIVREHNDSLAEKQRIKASNERMGGRFKSLGFDELSSGGPIG
jgi:hypothetical protein